MMKLKDAVRPLAIALTAAVLVVLGVATVAPAVFAQEKTPETILPGHWQYSYKIGGILPVGKEMKCLTAKDVAQFSDGICTRRFKCVYERKVVGDGNIDLKGVWYDKKNRPAPVKGKGTYTPESFKIDVNVTTIHGLPLAGVMEAKRVAAACPAATE